MFFYKNYPKLIRTTPSKMRIPLDSFPEEWKKYCDKEGWFEPETACRRGRRKLRFSIERYKRKKSNNFNNFNEGQETDWEMINERNDERNEKGMLYSNPF